MKKVLLFLVCVCLSGCIVTKESELKQEEAEVIQLSYIPRVTSNISGVAPGISSSGNMTMSFVSGTSVSPEVFAVVLRCSEHQKTFALKSKEMYERVKPGDKITLKYVDIIQYDNKDSSVQPKVIDYVTKGFIY